MPRPYDLEEDVSFGLAEADFPVTFYDRPELMFANMLRGDVDGLTRSMLAPDTLSPRQMQDVKDRLLKGKKTNPITKTILEIATNPLVWIGALAMVKYPIGSTNALLALRKGLIPKTASMGKMVSGLHGGLEKLRSVPEAFETLWGIFREKSKFLLRHSQAMDDIFQEANATRPLSKAEGYMVSARLDGLHSTDHYMFKLLRNEPEYIAFMGDKNTPIAAGLQQKLGRRLNSIADKMKGVYHKMFKDLRPNEQVRARMDRAAHLKGQQIGEKVEFYHPHAGEYDKYYKRQLRGYTKKEFRRHLSYEYEAPLSRHEMARRGGMFANREHVLELETAGVVPKGFTSKVTDPILQRWSDEAAGVAKGIWDDVSKLNLSVTGERGEFIKRMRQHYTTGPGKNTNLIARLGNKNMADETLDAMAGALQDAGGNAAELATEFGEIGKVMGQPASYSLNPWESFHRYAQSTSSDFAYHATGLGAKMTSIIKTPGIFKGETHLESYIVDGIMPHILGYNTYGQMQRSILASTRNMKIIDWMKNHPFVQDTLGPKHTKTIVDWLSRPGAGSVDEIGGQAAGWFHLSTLGANLSATSANAMQTFITTVNHVGFKGLGRALTGYAGQEGLISRVNRYIGMRVKGIASEKAFQEAFPEFVKEMGAASQVTERLLAGDVASAGYPKLFKAKGVWDKVKTGLMLPFSKTEEGNQLLAFYSGRYAHMAQHAQKIGTAALSAEASKVGGTLALMTQFAGGPMGIPSHIMHLNPMWRQYMHFPMRMLGYIHNSLRLGTDPNKLNWGSIGRMLGISTAGYIAARNIAGIDLSRGLLAGALPLPGYERGVFYPFPLVPPTAAVIGEIGKAALTGNPEQLGSVAAMLIPGGTAARRLYRGLAPKYADYENPTQDGRVPLYNDDGALIGSMTPMELTLRSIGLRPSSVSAEAGAAQWLLGQRDRVRGYRREYTMALFRNDTREADKINREFQKAYPELGPIRIKKSDLRALQNRREMSRIHRITRGISSAYRPIFEQVVGGASLNQLTSDVQMGGAGALENYFPLQ